MTAPHGYIPPAWDGATCRPDGFISLRRAKRAAWKRTDAGKPTASVWCPACE